MAIGINPTDYAIRWSGGATNENHLLSIGGAKSSKTPFGQTAVWAGTAIPGITLLGANFTTPGAASIFYDQSLGDAEWISQGQDGNAFFDLQGRTGEECELHAYYVEDEGDPHGSCLNVTITSASLPGADDTKSVTVANNSLVIFPDVTEAIAETGVITYRGFYVEVSTTGGGGTLRGAILNESSGGDYIEWGWATEGFDTPMATLTDENTAPAGVIWNSGSEFQDEIDFDGHTYHGVWLKRTVPTLHAQSTIKSAASFFLASYEYAYTPGLGFEMNYSVSASRLALALLNGTATSSYVCVLKGNGSTIPDIELPMKSFRLEKSNSLYPENDSLSIYVDSIGVDIVDIYDRRDFDIKVTQTIAYGSGDSVVTVVAEMPLIDINLFSGGGRNTLSLGAEEAVTHTDTSLMGEIVAQEIRGNVNSGSFEVVMPGAKSFLMNPGNFIYVEGQWVQIDKMFYSVRGGDVETCSIRRD